MLVTGLFITAALATAEMVTGQVVLSVSDTGTGIPLEVQSCLFQKCAAGEQEEHGSGVGLAFCKLAVEAHEGRIWVESTSERGTTIAFSLAATEGDRIA